MMAGNPIEQFRDAIHSSGLTPPETIEADGKLRRFASNGRRNDDAGWYLFHGDGIPSGSFGDWRTGLTQSWRADIGRALTPGEEAAQRMKVEAMRREREADDAGRRAEVAATAATILKATTPATDDHAYLVRKGIKANGALLHQGKLVIPMRSGGDLHSLQFMGEDGEKRFLTGGRVAGCYFSIGSAMGAAALCIAEGFATGASIHEATGYPVAVAFNAGNLLSVVKAMRAKFPDLPLIPCADDDYLTDGNPGMTKADEAARAVGGLLAIPDFGTDRPDGATDFNDMVFLCGANAVKHAVAGATGRARAAAYRPDEGGATGSDSAIPAWPEPQPVSAKVEPEPYPIDALPETIRAAVEAVAGFVKAPLAMVVSSALGALSLACQAHVDVKRAEKLTGPASLFLLNVLWEGGTHSVGRRASESFMVKGARLTVALQIQEPTLRSFFDKSGMLARGSGFLARFLVAWPESTQGHRPFSEAPANWPHLAIFQRRIAEILNLPAPIGDDGALTPQMLALTPAATAAWVEYHDAIEDELRAGGELYDVRDVASKSADNAVRLAALFHVFAYGAGAVGLEAFDGASRIAAWPLNESRRFFGELALPAELADAARLDSWLIEHCKRERTHLVLTREAQRLGPVRDKEKLATALRELEELDRARVTQEGRRKTIKVNPALVGVTP